MLQFVGHGAAVGLLQTGQGLGEGIAGSRDPQHRLGDGHHHLGRQAEWGGVQRRIADRLAAEGIEPGGQVAVGAMRLDQRHRRGHVIQVGLALPDGAGGGADAPRRHALRHRGRRQGGEPQAGESVFIEAVVTLEEVVQRPEELAGLRTLDHPMVVGAGGRHDLGDAEFPEPVVGEIGEGGGIGDGADGDDAPLARHQARHRGDRSDAARVGQRHSGAREGIRQQLVAARLLHQRLVGGMKLGEALGLGIADHRHHQAAAAVLALHVHRDAQVHGPALDPVRSAVHLQVGGGHDRQPLGGAGEGVPDQMGEGHLLAAAGGAEGTVELTAAGLQQRDGEFTKRGGGGNGPAVVHVADEPGGRSGDGRGVRGQRRGSASRRPGCALRVHWRGGGPWVRHRPTTNSRVAEPRSRRADGWVPIALELRPQARGAGGEEPPPLLGDGGGVAQVRLVHDLGETGVGGLEHVHVHGSTTAFRELGHTRRTGPMKR